MQLYDFKQEINVLTEKLEIINTKLGGLDDEIVELEKSQQDPLVWSDPVRVAKLSKELKILKDKQTIRNKIRNKILDLNTAVDLLEESPEFITEEELTSMIKDLQEDLQEMWISTLLSEECDEGNAVIMLHSGAGGEEAQDWAQMLARMYTRYCVDKGYKVTLLDTTPGDGAGIKSQTYLIEGEFAYGYLKAEKGVHRLVRLSPFDANNRRHTSFASLEVSPFIESSGEEVNINLEDIIVDTYRSSGAGGQHVNKTESAIRITHKPTGIVVTCQNERSQIRNREMAMKLLASKLKELELEKKEQEKMSRLAQNKKIEWGSQIRSYVLHPYSLVKDHRTGYETGNVQEVLNGGLQTFINEYLKVINSNEE